MKKWLIIVSLFVAAPAFAQPAKEAIQKGNDLYRQKQYEQAAAEYNKAIEADPADKTAKLNLANSLQKQGKQEEAMKLYDEIAPATNDKQIKAQALYNKGVVLSQQKRLEESIDAYKNALRINPNDQEARENLQKALLELKKKNPPKKNNEQQKKKEQQKQQPQPKISKQEAEQRLKLLEQKEKQVQERLQKDKNKGGGSQTKDW